MPIGKNAIKRVSNSGYSNVKTSAPDMENSTEVVEKIVTTEKKTSKKPSPKAETRVQAPKKKASPKKSMEKEPTLSPVSTAKKVIEKKPKTEKRQSQDYVNIGGELPIHLL